MKLLLFLITFLLILPSNKLDCSDLKKGKFQTTNDDGSVTIISRKGKKQIENFRNGERISEFDVTWTNDCEYLIYNRNVTKGNDLWPEMNSDTLRIKIIEIKDGYYFTESEMLSKGWKMNQKVQILNTD
jgi:hypothetical protein